MTILTHHQPNTSPPEHPEAVSVDMPSYFEGERHKDSVLIGARAVVQLVESEQRARTDHQTQLANRLGFDESLDVLLSEDSPHVALIYFDLDNFKEVNDTSGHDVGDEVLQVCAEIIRNSVTVRESEGEVLARIGGDEFAAAIKTVNQLNDNRDIKLSEQEVIDGFTERVRNKVSELGEKIGVPQLGLSVGIVKFRESGFEEETVDEFKKRADIALYGDKSKKANR